MITIKYGKVFISVGFLLAIVVVLYLATSVIPKTLITLSKAETVQPVSVQNSLIIGQKIMAQAGDDDKCIVNVFILDKEGKGIRGKTVQLTGLGLHETTTDSLGKATFELTSNTAGQYDLIADVDGLTLNSTVTVTFR